MSASRRATIRANLFPAAHSAVEPWDSFRWHSASGESCDTWKRHSSQALAIDVFGTIKVASARDIVLDRLADEIGLPVGGPWTLELEWANPDNPLHERQPTWVDAVARNARSLIFFECKFTETDGGSCSQTRPLVSGPYKGLTQCNGSYMWQVNPVNHQESRCALTAKGIRYWEAVSRVFDYAADGSYVRCPFAGPRFQWMRNLTNCWVAAQQADLQAAFVVVYANGPGLAMAERVKSPLWLDFQSRLQPDAILFRTMPYQQIVAFAQDAVPHDPLWPELAAWVTQKIDSVCQRIERK